MSWTAVRARAVFQATADRTAAAEHVPDERLVDDRDPRDIRVVGLGEQAARDWQSVERREKVRLDRGRADTMRANESSSAGPSPPGSTSITWWPFHISGR
jgi:hypothetical protein